MSNIIVKNPLIVAGGEEPNLQSKYISISSNGTTYYYPSSDNCDGYNQVEVDVSVSQNVGYKSISSNGTYYASSDGYQGYDQVYVNVSPNIGYKAIYSNGDYYSSSDGRDGYDHVYVNVSPNLTEKTITSNGTYNASDDGVQGYRQVTVRVPGYYESNDTYYVPCYRDYGSPQAIGSDDYYYIIGTAASSLSVDTNNVFEIMPNLRYNIGNLANLTTLSISNNNAGDHAVIVRRMAFASAPNLSTIYVCGCPCTLEEYAFANCSQLTSAYLYTDDSVYNFGSFPRYCFSGCSSLSYVKIGSAIWGYGMFDGCDSLDTIDFQGTMQEWNTNVAARSSGWNSGSSVTTIHCTDGDITL